MTLVERFLKYVSFDTQSNEESGVTPSTPGQMVFARFLKEELEALGLEEITLDENGYLFATLPANIDKSVPVVGFIAHMDTSPDMSGKDVSPRIVENYDGKDIVLCADEQVVLSPARFPELLDHKGEDLIQSAIYAARLRFRPILMTSLAFVLGMLPMVLASGPGSASRQAIGTGVFFGMIFAIVFGIILVPFFFVMVYKTKSKILKHKK